jgi:[acyl-carrier-protein] S-malonyltransferase
MQNSVPKGEGGMVAVLGSTVETIEKILKDNEQNLSVQIANDNSEGQIVVSGKINDLDKLISILKENNIKNIKLPVSAPFHCTLMNKATNIMSEELNKLNFTEGKNKLISNVTAKEIANTNELKDLLIKQIENRVRWRESVINMINDDINHFIEIGPGKVLSGLIKRINKGVKIDTINNQEDIEDLKI